MRFSPLVCLIVCVLAPTSCYMGPIVTEGPTVLTKQYEFEASKDVVWETAIEHLSSVGFIITTLEKDSGFIHVELAIVDSTYMDCQTVMPNEEIRQREHTVSFTITIREENDSLSKLFINLRTFASMTYTRGLLNVSQGYDWYNCPSSGKFEGMLWNAISSVSDSTP